MSLSKAPIKISVVLKGNSLKLSRFELFLSQQTTRNKCFGAEIKVKIVNHIKPWKLKEGDSCIYSY